MTADAQDLDPGRSAISLMTFTGFAALTITTIVVAVVSGVEDGLLGSQRDLTMFASSLGASFLVITAYAFALQRGVRQDQHDLIARSQRELSAAHDRFLARTSDALHTPLARIVATAHQLNETRIPGGNGSGNAVAGCAARIDEEAAELGRLIDDMLVAARLDAANGDYSRSDVQAPEAFISVLIDAKQRGLRIDTDCHQALVSTVPEALSHILRNLVDNAKRHGRGTIEVRGVVRGGSYLLDVSDQGTGLTAEQVEALQEASTADQTPPGIGLGLSVAQRLCHAIGAELDHRKTSGRSHFTVEIPLAFSDPRHRLAAPTTTIRSSLERLGLLNATTIPDNADLDRRRLRRRRPADHRSFGEPPEKRPVGVS